jgi:hypothetical protein
VDLDQSQAECFAIRYTFSLPESTREFIVQLRRDTLALIPAPRASYPDWVALSHHQCGNCPLQPERHPHCPVAASIVDVVEYFQDLWSFEEIEVEIAVGPRTVRMRSAVQNALSGLTGVYMVTSGCPILDQLRPMVYSHLPFGSLEETMYRALAMYSLAQVLRHRKGLPAEWDLSGLAKIYEEVGVVNRSFHHRLPVKGTKEAGRNAVISLDCYAQYTSNRSFDKALDELEGLFRPLLKP